MDNNPDRANPNTEFTYGDFIKTFVYKYYSRIELDTMKDAL